MIFNFDRTYLGGIILNNEYVPCKLTFTNGIIQISIAIIDNISHTNFNVNEGICGYLSTEKTIWYFFSEKFIQTKYSYGEEIYSLDDFMIGKSKTDFKNMHYDKINLRYDNLIKLDMFVSLERNNDSFSINSIFEEIKLFQTNEEHYYLKNNYSWSWRNFNQEYFEFLKDPSVQISKKSIFNSDKIKDIADEFAWFLLLLFGVKQSINSIELIQENFDNNNNAFYYFHKSIIKNHLRNNNSLTLNGDFYITDVLNEIELYFTNWRCKYSTNKTLFRLYFNELMSENYVLDDRFKNLCSIIQGLENVCFIRIKKDVNNKLRNTMNYILISSFDEFFLKLLNEYVEIDFLSKFLSIIANLRDYFQHLNKKIDVDLSQDVESMHCINLLLSINIRYHLLKSISIKDEHLTKIINREISFIQLPLKRMRDLLMF